MSGVIRVLGRVFTLPKLHPVVFIVAQRHIYRESLKTIKNDRLAVSHCLNALKKLFLNSVSPYGLDWLQTCNLPV